MIRSSNILSDFERLSRGLNFGPEFDRMVSDISQTVSSTLGPNRGGVDAFRTADTFELHLDLPGVDPATVDLTVEGRTLSVTADRKFEFPEGAEVIQADRAHSTVAHSFKLGDDLDVEQIAARSNHGVLVITIPVAASAQPRKVAITIDPETIETQEISTGSD